MSTTAARKPMPLNLIVDSRVRPEKQERHGLLLKLSRDEFDALLSFTHAVQKRTGHRVSQQAIGRTALRSFLCRHVAWTLPDQQASA